MSHKNCLLKGQHDIPTADVAAKKFPIVSKAGFGTKMVYFLNVETALNASLR